jgi:hypothetical protein
LDNLKSYSNLLNLEISPEINNNYSLLEEPFSVPEVLEFITNTKPNLNAISPSKVLVSKELVCLNDVSSDIEESTITISSLSSEFDIRSSYATLENKFDIANSSDFQYLLNIFDLELLSLESYPDLSFSPFSKPILKVPESTNPIQMERIERESLKLKIRDKCVDGVAQIFKFKKWAYKRVQRPLNDFIRSKTGDRILKSPHLVSFKRKYGFESDLNFKDIKKERIESIVYRWRHYNKINFYADFDDSQTDEFLLLPRKFYKERFVPLPLKFCEIDFLSNKNYPVLNNALNESDPFLPQSDFMLRRSLKSETDPLSISLDFDKKFFEDRNNRARRSLRYYVNFPLINSNIQNERIRKRTNLPIFLLGPEILKSYGINTNDSCGYGLGYLRVGSQKIYMNPATGLFSYYKSIDNQIFNGDDKTTYFGIENNRGYYSDSKGTKYFYAGNYIEINSARSNRFKFMNSSPNGLPTDTRRNPYLHKSDFYLNPLYTSIKRQAGPWNDVGGLRRHKFSSLYPVSKKYSKE